MKIWGVLVSLLLIAISGLQAQDKGWFSSREITTVTLRTDLQVLWADRGDESSDHPAWISLPTDTGTLVVEAEVKTGGNFRKDPRNCKYPPLRVDPKGKSAKGTLFQGQGTMKLITICQDPNYVLKEYLAYRIYNLMTDSSYQVRLSKVVFEDIAGRIPAETNWALWVESEKHLAQRLDMERFEDDSVIHRPSVSASCWARVCVFQYIIGNTDWDLPLKKNVTVLSHAGICHVVPFDFDWSKWVDAAYTGLKDDPSFEHRSFRGKGLSREVVDAVLTEVVALRETLVEEVKSCKSLPSEHRKEIVEYLDVFFKSAENPKTREELFLSRCMPEP